MNWLNEHLVQFLAVSGLALLAIEVWVLGFATFFLFFIGIGLLITSGLIHQALIPASVLSAVMSTSLITVLSALILWKPLNTMQNRVEKKPVTSDMVGHSFVLDAAVSPQHPGSYRYSGIEWKLHSNSALPKGTRVKVIEVQVGVFVIAAQDS
ncbi:NfeD family protein [Alteromonas aestuariivivens]|uniref:NfeD family protein n=1 Tax=Alteromonas aestuariivivens TaxID=1938339 RepID=A0A3D8M370_9ALTE|nr:NfeD family protein [Alteromonas aestuariivivens]RDV24173.1 NfeD family protein [Alteromonas aestuariivivens]